MSCEFLDTTAVMRLPTLRRCGSLLVLACWALVADDSFSRHLLADYDWASYPTQPYPVVRAAKPTRYLHQIVFAHYHGELQPGYEIDHIDRNPLNSTPWNLRALTHSENIANRARQSNNTSGYVGVVWHKAAGKWMARIHHYGKGVYLGLYPTPQDAAAVVNAAYARTFPHVPPPNQL